MKILTSEHRGRIMFVDANVTVMISDMDRSIKFYVETLGLKLTARYGNHFAQIDAMGTTIALHPSSKNGSQPGKSESLSIGLGVVNLENTMTLLKEKGVTFSGEVLQDGPVKLAFFTDPDRNPLY
jgi:catechol 2,3-dioxygenase-like lactoylglutathione lyase family enzyme